MNWLGDPHGHGASAVSTLGYFVFGVFSLATLVMLGLLVWILAVRRRGTLGEHLPWYTGGGKAWIVIGGLAVPALVFLVVLVLGLSTMHAAPLEGHDHHGPADVIVAGRQWWWELRYPGAAPDQEVISANELHIATGRPFVLELTSRDVIHSFWVPELHGKMDAVPGRKTRLVLEARRPGTYVGQCSEFCGEQHAKMRIVVVAHEPDDYERWLAAQRQPAAMPATPLAVRGQELFVSRACGLCHTIRGTRALGSVGPDLTHVGSRLSLAGNSLPNKHAYVAAWSVAAQSLKPENQMPNLGQLTGEELDALAAYLGGLK
jgi:cytochrome c oxidase subunit 2